MGLIFKNKETDILTIRDRLAIYRSARELRKKLQDKADLEKYLINEIGIPVISTAFNKKEIRALSYFSENENERFIMLSKKSTENDRLFDLFHEFCHYDLKHGNLVFFRSNGYVIENRYLNNIEKLPIVLLNALFNVDLSSIIPNSVNFVNLLGTVKKVLESDKCDIISIDKKKKKTADYFAACSIVSNSEFNKFKDLKDNQLVKKFNIDKKFIERRRAEVEIENENHFEGICIADENTGHLEDASELLKLADDRLKELGYKFD